MDKPEKQWLLWETPWDSFPCDYDLSNTLRRWLVENVPICEPLRCMCDILSGSLKKRNLHGKWLRWGENEMQPQDLKHAKKIYTKKNDQATWKEQKSLNQGNKYVTQRWNNSSAHVLPQFASDFLIIYDWNTKYSGKQYSKISCNNTL